MKNFFLISKIIIVALFVRIDCVAQAPNINTTGGPPPSTLGTHTCQIAASSNTNGGRSGIVYDDGAYVYDGNSYQTLMAWNCNRRFLFADYLNTDITFTFAYNTSFWNPTSLAPSPYHDVKVYDNSLNLLTTYSNRADTDPIVFSSSTKGTYTVAYFRPGTSTKDLEAYVDLIPKIERIWISATPIPCDFFDGTSDYYFEVHTYPEIADAMFQDGAYGWPQSTTFPFDCEFAIPFAYTLEFSNVSIPIYHTTGYSTVSYVTALATLWDVNTPSNNPDCIHYRITKSDLYDFIDAYYNSSGVRPYIEITFDDHISSPTIVNSPIIVNESLSTILSHQANSIPSLSFHYFDYTLTGDETWNATNNQPVCGTGSNADVLRIQNKLTIPEGIKLNVKDLKIEFGPTGSVEVKADYNTTNTTTEGGRFVLDNSQLNPYIGCGNQNVGWSGVQVWGNTTRNQNGGSAPGTSQYPKYQACIEMKNNSVISYAKLAVNLCSPNGKGGGVIKASNSGFYNNEISVEFMPYSTPATNRSFMQQCRFQHDALSIYSGFAGIMAVGVKGVRVLGCSFTNSDPIHMNNMYGIAGNDFGVSVDRNFNTLNNSSTSSTFYRMTEGIHINTIAGTTSVGVQNTDFIANELGVELEGGAAPLVANNKFRVPYGANPHYPHLYGNQCIGMNMFATAGYTVKNNEFGSLGNKLYTTGFLAWNTGSDPHAVRHNQYNYLGVGNGSNYVNTAASSLHKDWGLQFLCNDHTYGAYDESMLGNNSSTNGIALEQGTSSTPAGNSFSTSGNTYNIYNPSNKVVGITYYYDPAGSNANPANNSGVTKTATASNTTSCPSDNIGIISDQGNINGLVQSWTPGPLADYAAATNNVNYYLRYAYVVNDTDTVSHRDSVYYWAKQMHSPYGDLLRACLLVEDSLVDSANHVYDSISYKYSLNEPESSEFSTWGRAYMDVLVAVRANASPMDISSLNSTQADALRDVVAGGKMWARVRAENWLRMYDSSAYTDTVLYPCMSGVDTSAADTLIAYDSAWAKHGNPGSGYVAKVAINKIYPNPVHDALKIVYDCEKAEYANLQIYDMTGRILVTQDIRCGIVNNIDLSELKTGLYLYKITEGNKATQAGKLLKE